MTQLKFGDLSPAPVDQMSALVNGVVLPLLHNDNNQAVWPQVVSRDIVEHASTLKSSAFVVSGQMKGETLLPLPVGTEHIGVTTEVRPVLRHLRSPSDRSQSQLRMTQKSLSPLRP